MHGGLNLTALSICKGIAEKPYSIKKAIPLDTPTPVFAVKFIHKDHAVRHGRLTLKQISMEISLHQHLGHHSNIVQFFQTGEDPAWRWIAMELAEGGDLFDKIESDVGVGEDIAQFYFTQLISAVEYMHSKGIGHRDIKPENILLSKEGDLKVADFGLATLFEYKGKTKLCTTSCGSPPYTAPEVVTCDARIGGMRKLETGYRGDLVDIWSCGVVLFVLLVGNTPWDEPLERSFEFDQYVKTEHGGLPDDELWHNLPVEAVSLLKGMMRVKAEDRYSIAQVRRHPWIVTNNSYLGDKGRLENPVGLATEMFESMKIDFSQDPMASQRSQLSGGDAMDLDDGQGRNVNGLSMDHIKSPTQDIMFDRERPSQGMAANTQSSVEEKLVEEPSMSQFSSTPQVPLTKTQFARQFGDILPNHSLNRFYSTWPIDQVHGVISAALHQLEMFDTRLAEHGNPIGSIKVRGMDTRNCPMSGDVVIENMHETDGQLLEVSLLKAKGDPVEWRRMFKRVVLLCKDVVFRPDEHMALFSQMSQG